MNIAVKSSVSTRRNKLLLSAAPALDNWRKNTKPRGRDKQYQREGASKGLETTLRLKEE